MKKIFKGKIHGGSSSAGGQDTDNLLYKINQRLEFLEKKIDALVARGASGETTFKSRPPLSEGHGSDRPDFRRDRSDSFPDKREFTKVKCGGCGEECTVPFKPIGDRPVYCRTCFSKQKDNFAPRDKFAKRGKSDFDYKRNRR